MGLEIVRRKSKAEVANKFKRKKKRVLDKQTGEEGEEAFENKDEYMNNVVNWFEVVKTVKLKHKIDSLVHIPSYKGKDNLVAVLFSNNTFAIKQLVATEDSVTLKEVATFENLGHQSVVRSVSFSQDDSMVISVSSECVKLWTSLKDFQAVKTFQIIDGISAAFLPHLRYSLLATRAGNLSVLNADSGAVEFTVEKAHADTIWKIDWIVLDNDLVIGTCSSDGLIKFWNLTERVKTKTVCLEVLRSVQIGEPMQWLKFNNSGKYYAAALMDNSIQVVLAD